MTKFSLANDRIGIYWNDGTTSFSVQASKGNRDENLIRAIQAGAKSFQQALRRGRWSGAGERTGKIQEGGNG